MYSMQSALYIICNRYRVSFTSRDKSRCYFDCHVL
nr:MAG TPA: hypothetical protein [Caudoviricetes sp.]